MPAALSQEMALRLKKRLNSIDLSIALLESIRKEIMEQLNARR